MVDPLLLHSSTLTCTSLPLNYVGIHFQADTLVSSTTQQLLERASIHCKYPFKSKCYQGQIPQGFRCLLWAHPGTGLRLWAAGDIHSSWDHKQNWLGWPAPAPWLLQCNKTALEGRSTWDEQDIFKTNRKVASSQCTHQSSLSPGTQWLGLASIRADPVLTSPSGFGTWR